MKILFLVVALCAGCVTSGPYSTELRAGVAIGEHNLRSNPVGVIQVTQPLPWLMELTYTHISSIPDSSLASQFDGIGIGACVRFPLRGCRGQ